MRFVGITGTKGKTTTSYMVKSICEQAGFKCGLVGTTGNMIGEKHIPSSKTTPDPIDLREEEGDGQNPDSSDCQRRNS